MSREKPAKEERGGRPRRVLLRILSALVLLGGGLELGLRVWARATQRERGLVYDPLLGWRMRPNLTRVGEWWSANEPARTNSRGWRDAEFDLRPTPGTRRVVVVGDSFTFGVSVDYGERFTERLEELVPGLEVLNLGVNAYGTDQELLLLESEGLAYEPDLVLLAVYLGNDLDDIRHVRRFGWPRPWFEFEGGELVLHPPRATWDVRLRNLCYLGEALLRLIGDPMPGEIRAPAWETADTLPLFDALVARMAAACERAEARFLVMLIHSPGRILGAPTPAERAARAALEARGIELLDTFELFAASEAAGRPGYIPDGHWNVHGHALAAEALAPLVR